MCLCSRVSQGFLIACLTVIALAAVTRYQAAHADSLSATAPIAIEQLSR